MINLLHRSATSSRTSASLLGLALDGDRLEGTVVRLERGALQASRSFTATLTLDPLTHEPELVGREILNHLETAGIRERRCVVGVPLKWVLTTDVTLPALPEADRASFIQIEAERTFPCDVTTLSLATSLYAEPSGTACATIAGIPASHLERLTAVLRAARLTPLSFALGIAALQPPEREDAGGVLALAIGATQVDLQLTCGGGVARLRVLDGVYDAEGGDHALHGDRVARDMRITLGQLSAGLRAALKRIRIFGSVGPARQLAAELRACGQADSLEVDVVADAPAGAEVTSSFSLAAGRLQGRPPPFEFLAPRPSSWKRLSARYGTGTWRRAGIAAAALITLIGLAFAVQQVQLVRLNSRWTRMEPNVLVLQDAQQQIQRFRPWDDKTFRCLSILRSFSAVFPEDGGVTAKTLEIHDLSKVSCSGTARDNAALLRMLGQLRATDNVQGLRVVQIRGGAPIQFTFECQCGGASQP